MSAFWKAMVGSIKGASRIDFRNRNFSKSIEFFRILVSTTRTIRALVHGRRTVYHIIRSAPVTGEHEISQVVRVARSWHASWSYGRQAVLGKFPAGFVRRLKYGTQSNARESSSSPKENFLENGLSSETPSSELPEDRWQQGFWFSPIWHETKWSRLRHQIWLRLLRLKSMRSDSRLRSWMDLAIDQTVQS